ncbi:MAG: glycosyltransferase family 61 protein [Lentisphaeria bacterium]|nr:glycosyltransferase family 61 protein [Lentisphaeria bacterium]
MDNVKRIFYPDDTGEFLITDWMGDHQRKESLKIREIESGVVLPPYKIPNPYGGFYMETGVLSASGVLIPDSGMFSAPVPPPVPEGVSDAAMLDESVIFCGMLYFHYGHFLIQSTSRLYCALQNTALKIVFAVTHIPEHLPAYMMDFFQLLGIPLSRLILIDRPTRFSRIILPDISSRYFQDWTPEFLMPFKKAAENIPPAKDEKVFFSRKRWTGIAKCFGEEALEKLFVRNGFKPVMLETLSLAQQIACIKGAKVLAGINGTAFHNILFGEPGKKLIFLNRNPEYDSQYILNNACESDWYVVKVHANPLPVNHPHGPFIVGVTPDLREFCKVHKLDCGRISFCPEKYLRRFLNRFIYVYAQKNCFQEYQARYHNKLPADALIALSMATRRSDVFKRFFYRVLGKILPGKYGEHFRVIYAALRDCRKYHTEWKY